MNLFPQLPRLRRRRALRWPGQAQVIRLNEGDRVLVVCGRGVNVQQLNELDEALHARFPGVAFTITGGDIQSVAVQSAEEEERT